MFGNIAYYLVGPIFIFSKLFNKSNLIDFTYLLILIRISLCGLTMFYYLKKHFNISKSSKLLIFSTIYALSGFLINFYYNIMWLPAIYMLPLLAMSLEELVNSGKSVKYILCLFYIILCNYYIGYMICIFSVLYFCYLVVNKYNFKKDKKVLLSIFLKYLLSSIVAGLLAMIIIVPSYYNLLEGFKIESASVETILSQPSSFLHVFGRLFVGSANVRTVTNFLLPNIYSSLLALPLTYIYILRSERKNKISSLIFLVIIFSAFFIPVINYVWHGFSYPNWLNYRFSFIISFVLVLFSVKIFVKDDFRVKWYELIIFYVVFLGLSFLLYRQHYEWLTTKIIVINDVIMFIYLVLLYFLQKKSFKFYGSVLIGLFAFVELFLNGYLVIRTYDNFSNEDYYWYVNASLPLIEEYLPKENEFYRMEKNYYIMIDENFIHGNYGINAFLSTYNKRAYHFLENVGYKANAFNSTYYSPLSTRIMESILGFKYVFLLDNQAIMQFGPLLDGRVDADFINNDPDQDDVGVFYNKHHLSLGYMVNEKAKDIKFSDSVNSVDYQKNILSGFIGKDSKSLTKVEPIESHENYLKVKLPENMDVAYLSLNISANYDVQDRKVTSDYKYSGLVYINNYAYAKYDDTSSNILMLTHSYAGKEIEIRFEKTNGSVKVNSFDLYTFSKDTFDQEISLLEDNLFEIEKFDNTYIKGKVNVTDNKVFFSSIPNERGWNVYVDGIKVKHYDLLDCFIGFDLEEGEHTIEFKYSLPGLIPGAILSFIGVIGLTGIIIYEKRKRY